MSRFLLATGIECSYPVVDGRRRDQLEETRHYRFWREDFELCREIGARVLRYGPPYYRMHLGPKSYDWSFTDEVLPVLRELGIMPILDLCHFGVPDWMGDFQNEDWPQYFAEYAYAFAERYPWIQYYTPVNEMLVCARFSAKEGIWNEQLNSDKAMIRAHAIQCKATLLAIEEIRKIRPDAVFIQSETCEVFLEEDPSQSERVALLNSLRFITFDFLYGHPPVGNLLMFLLDNGLEQGQYEWFMEHGRKAAPHCVMGMDYYGGNEVAVRKDGSHAGIGPAIGWSSIARQYATRYRKPIMLTETNTGRADEAPKWLWDTWHNASDLRADGFPVIGYTWYSLQDQVDWDIQLREFRGHEVANGLFTLERKPNPVAAEFKKLCQRYRDQPLLTNFAMGAIPGGQPKLRKARMTKRKSTGSRSAEVVVITGESAGIGRATAREFARRGAHLALIARGRDGLDAARGEVEEVGGKALVIEADVADPQAVEQAADRVEKELGPIDVWVNNAFAGIFSELLDITPDEYRRVTEVTYLGQVWGTMAALCRMVRRDRGSVVLVGSALAYRGIPLQSAYCGAKHAIQGFQDSVRSELLHHKSNVQLTMVQLPGVNTPQFDWVRTHIRKEPRPTGAVYQPEVAAKAIHFAAHSRRKQVIVGLPALEAILGDKVASPLLDRYLGRTGFAGQERPEAVSPDRKDNLFEPVGGDHGARGAFDDEAHRSSPQLWATMHRKEIGLAAAGVAAAGAGWLLSRGKRSGRRS